VIVAGEPAQPLEPVVGHQCGRGGGLVVEPLHPDHAGGPVAQGGPPRPAVTGFVAGRGPVHVGGHRGHLVVGEQAGDVQEPGLGEEGGHLLRRLVGGEGAAEIERCAVGVAQFDGAGHVGGPVVEHRPQHEPPAQRGFEPPAAEVQPARGQPPHRGHLVVDEIGELPGVDAQRRSVGRTGANRHAAAGGIERPAAAVDVDGQGREVQEGQRRSQAVSGRVERGGEVGGEEPTGIHRVHRSIGTGSHVGAHDRSPSGRRVDGSPSSCRTPCGCGHGTGPGSW
jgi:hypothetical protein